MFTEPKKPGNNFNTQGTVDLFIAASSGDIGKARDILLSGVSPNIQDNLGNTALMIAARKNKVEMVNLLLEMGSNPELRNKLGMSPLMVAASAGSFKTTEALITKTRDIDQWDNQGRTPLIHAVSGNNLNIVTSLLKAGANPNFEDNFSRTPLMYAAKENKIPIFNSLKEKSDYPNEAFILFDPKGFHGFGHASFILINKSGSARIYDYTNSKRHHWLINKLSDYGLPVSGNCRRFSLPKAEVTKLKKRFIEGDLTQKLENTYLERYTRCVGAKDIPPLRGSLMAWKAEDKAIVHGIYSLFDIAGTNCVTLGHKILNQLGYGFSKRVSPCGVYSDGVHKAEKKGLTTDNNKKAFSPLF